jgi:hypothetical protein
MSPHIRSVSRVGKRPSRSVNQVKIGSVRTEDTRAIGSRPSLLDLPCGQVTFASWLTSTW